MKWPSNPRIYEINTWTKLNHLTKVYNEQVSLDNMPEEIIKKEWKSFDAIWLMGVWKRSAQGKEIAKNHQDLQKEYRNALSDFSNEDVVGSPYAIHQYDVDPHLGGDDGLKQIRERLLENDKLLILDYVPNHVAVDHPWIESNPEVFIQGTEQDYVNFPNDYFKGGHNVFANGKDPFFAPWTDTVQINAFSEEARLKTIETIKKIANQCDGIRCDMAMLMLDEVFAKTWSHKISESLSQEFWQEIITAIKKEFPDFIFLAEVYWDLEWKLMKLGFDYCYDKKLYERLIHDDARSVHGHLKAEWVYQSKLLRYIENHDETRAVKVFGKDKSKAAAVLAFTLPGARMIHEGQPEGHSIKLPIQLRRRPEEEDDKELMEFYQHLFNAAPGKEMKDAKWSLCRVDPVGTDSTYSNLISYDWWNNDTHRLIVVNFSPDLVKGHIRPNSIEYGNSSWIFTDLLNQDSYNYRGEDLMHHGLFVKLGAWNSHIFEIKKDGGN